MENKKKTVFEVLSQVDCKAYVEEKNGFTYLSWVHAWREVMERYPDSEWDVLPFIDAQGQATPYLYDPVLGYLVRTCVTIEGKTRFMQLPVMDGANKAQKATKYSYPVPEWAQGRKTGKMIDKFVEAATMFDINTAIMRCFTKNLA